MDTSLGRIHVELYKEIKKVQTQVSWMFLIRRLTNTVEHNLGFYPTLG